MMIGWTVDMLEKVGRGGKRVGVESGVGRAARSPSK